jgi:hypothetical protein
MDHFGIVSLDPQMFAIAGVGVASHQRMVVPDTSLPHLFLHFAWQFLTPTDTHVTI